MTHTLLNLVLELPNAVLWSRLDELAVLERKNQSLFLAHLAEVERRELFLAQGFSSLFSYVLPRNLPELLFRFQGGLEIDPIFFIETKAGYRRRSIH